MDANSARFGERRPGSVELTDLATLRKVGPALYEGVRARQPGAITRTERWWDITCELVTYPGEDPFKGFVAIGRDAAGEPDGYVRYKVEAAGRTAGRPRRWRSWSCWRPRPMPTPGCGATAARSTGWRR